MKCWKCGGHMSRNGDYFVCDSCGRTVWKKRKPYRESEKIDLTFAECVSLLGIAGMAWAISKVNVAEKKASRFSIKRSLRNVCYLFLSFFIYLMGIGLIVNGFEGESITAGNSIFMTLSGAMVIWGGILVSALKNKEYLSIINIVGSVAANIACKVLGLLIIFADIECIDHFGFISRIMVGTFFLFVSRKVYEVIKEI